jgi:hypothetical protein
MGHRDLASLALRRCDSEFSLALVCPGDVTRTRQCHVCLHLAFF